MDLLDACQFCAAYELYGNFLLQRTAEQLMWVPIPDEVTQLRAEIARLQVTPQPPPPSEESLSTDYSLANIQAFQGLNPQPQWMQALLSHFHTAASDISEDKTAHLLPIWRTLVSTYFRYQQTYRASSARHSSFHLSCEMRTCCAIAAAQ